MPLNKNLTIPNRSELTKKELKMMLDPLGCDAITDVDEIHHRHRRSTDDPYIKAMMDPGGKNNYRWAKIDDAERR
jgi:hypothetical protein